MSLKETDRDTHLRSISPDLPAFYLDPLINPISFCGHLAKNAPLGLQVDVCGHSLCVLQVAVGTNLLARQFEGRNSKGIAKTVTIIC